jgi:hypothetical protein
VPSRPSRGGFQGLLTAAPQPLPDEEPQPVPELPVSGGQPGPAAAPAGGQERQAASRPEPARSAAGASAPPSFAAVAGEGRVATTIRLHLPAATALNGAWLDQRMHVNPKLSYPEFASEIVRLGLAEFERQAKRQAGRARGRSADG